MRGIDLLISVFGQLGLFAQFNGALVAKIAHETSECFSLGTKPLRSVFSVTQRASM